MERSPAAVARRSEPQPGWTVRSAQSRRRAPGRQHDERSAWPLRIPWNDSRTLSALVLRLIHREALHTRAGQTALMPRPLCYDSVPCPCGLTIRQASTKEECMKHLRAATTLTAIAGCGTRLRTFASAFGATAVARGSKAVITESTQLPA